MQWLSNFFLDHYNFSIGALGTVALLGGASYFLGLGAVLRIIASITEVLAPLLRGFMEAVVEYLKTLYAGLKIVLNSWSAVLLVVSLVMASWAFGKVPAKIKEVQCKQEVVQLKKQVQVYRKAQPRQQEFRWPWE